MAIEIPSVPVFQPVVVEKPSVEVQQALEAEQVGAVANPELTSSSDLSSYQAAGTAPVALNAPPPPMPPSIFQLALQNHINQFDDDPDSTAAGINANCGFASALMAASMLGVDPDIAGNTYQQAMYLREQSSASMTDTDPVLPKHVIEALGEMGLDGVELTSTDVGGWQKQKYVDYMAAALSDDSSQEVFIIRGNPAYGGTDWSNATDGYSGGHFVTVVDYNPSTGKFLVMDPAASGPMWVSAQNVKNFLESPTGGSVIEVTAGS